MSNQNFDENTQDSPVPVTDYAEGKLRTDTTTNSQAKDTLSNLSDRQQQVIADDAGGTDREETTPTAEKNADGDTSRE